MCPYNPGRGSSIFSLKCLSEDLHFDFDICKAPLFGHAVLSIPVLSASVPPSNCSSHSPWAAGLPTFLRYFAWDYRVLRTFARHYSTGEIIPEKSVESMQGAKKMFAATELQLQVYTSNVINQQAFEI
ncbi:hypothetical protein I3760_03G101800 [Carya illinoinensis]|uniref:mitochondrial intermediate peptidase, mitochondrial-like isoform X2 n=1 Tax=Carya illinoinensis TaxID=32201 RepID=UPI001BF85981|nr:mitochondrial intermediate peptidase, mitochondrial-like isoform X2 [Carya illinoinensis]KAG2715928.1 hypothetical protein I3760_03G101800 [Carya illinoinensis]